MEFTAEDAKVAIRAAWAVLSSPLAQRVYVVGLGGLVLGTSYWRALTANILVAETFDKTMKLVRKARRGRRPTTAKGIENRRKRIQTIKCSGIWSSVSWAGISLFFGVLMPASALFLATLHYPWLDHGARHLVANGMATTAQLNHDQAAMFVADQTLRGGLFDLFEVFAFQMTAIDNNPAVIPFTIGLFLYHLFVESFVFSGLLLCGQVSWRLARTA